LSIFGTAPVEPDEVKRRLAEQQAADLVLVETGEAQSLLAPATGSQLSAWRSC
jgi:hypothetical protein